MPLCPIMCSPGVNQDGLPPSFSLDEVPEAARAAWERLHDELKAILGDELVAVWAYGGTLGSDRPVRLGDLDTHVVVKRSPDEATAQRIDAALDSIAEQDTVEWDVWFITIDDAHRPDSPPHAFRQGRRDTSWAIHRAHWLAGRYVSFHGPEPADIVPAPTWAEITVDLDRELEHVERHVVEGDTDPYEAAYAILNGSRILHSIETGDVVLSKQAAGSWALGTLPERWHPAVRAAMRAHNGQAAPGDAELLAAQMAPFVAMVRERLPAAHRPSEEPGPRWSGY